MKQRLAKEQWLRAARRTARKTNIAWWWQSFSPLACLLSLTGSAVVLWHRSIGILPSNKIIIATILAGLVAASLIAWLISRSRFVTSKMGLLQLDSEMKMKSRLTSAASDHGAWPDFPDHPSDGLHWRWTWVVTPLLLPFTALFLALSIPVSPVQAAKELPKQHPAIAAIEEKLRELESKQLVDNDDLEALKKALDEIKKQPEDQWFSHQSMEALDVLEREFLTDLTKLEKGLSKARSAIQVFEKFSPELSDAVKNRLALEFGESIKGLAENALKANPELLEQLKKIDPKMLGQINKEKLQELAQQLGQNQDAMRDILEAAGQLLSDEELRKHLAQLGLSELGQISEGDCPGDEICPGCLDPNCKEGNGLGKGGISRGPGHSPLRFGDETEIELQRTEQLNSGDHSQLLPGEMVDSQEIEHEIDQLEVAPRDGGEVKGIGTGGEAVWRNQLLPSERKALERFFE